MYKDQKRIVRTRNIGGKTWWLQPAFEIAVLKERSEHYLETEGRCVLGGVRGGVRGGWFEKHAVHLTSMSSEHIQT